MEKIITRIEVQKIQASRQENIDKSIKKINDGIVSSINQGETIYQHHCAAYEYDTLASILASAGHTITEIGGKTAINIHLT